VRFICRLIRLGPRELQGESSPCRFISRNENGQTIDYFYRCCTQLELEEALAGWLRGKIAQIQQRLANSTDPLLEKRVEFSKLAEALGKVDKCRFGVTAPTHDPLGVQHFLQGRLVAND
jgi:hypothetical protein